MRKLIIILLAGFLAASVPQGYAEAAGTTFDECKIGNCVVNITVVDEAGVKMIVASPTVLLVSHRGSNKARLPVVVTFRLDTAGYSFVSQSGISFKNVVEADKQFTPVSAVSDKIVKIDKNTPNIPKYTSFSYNIEVEDKDGNVLAVDPVIINGGGVGH